jgi:hypothetical protein
MNTVSDRDVDEIYQRGVAELVAHESERVASEREIKPRRVPIVAALVALGVPLAALAWSAYAIIGGHTKSDTPSHPPQSIAPVAAARIGQAVRVSNRGGLVAVVIVEKVAYATGGRGVDDQPPVNGFYAVADVLISTTSAIGSTASAQEFNNAQAQFNLELANLARAKQINDTKAILGSLALVNYYQKRVALLAQQLTPFEFKYQTSDGRTYAVSSGNALVSGFEPSLLGASGLPKGLTYGNVVFDVPSKGGVIQMTDPFSGVVGRWKLPAS